MIRERIGKKSLLILLKLLFITGRSFFNLLFFIIRNLRNKFILFFIKFKIFKNRSRICFIFVKDFYEADDKCEDLFINFANRIFEIIIERLFFVNKNNKIIKMV